MGVLNSATPKPFEVIIEKGNNQYESGFRNGILSTFKESSLSTRSITFKAIVDDDVKEMDSIFVGMRVDYYDKK